MLRRVSLTLAVCIGLSVSVCSAQDFAPQLLKYFPGKWTIKAVDGTQLGSLEWKLVAGGKAIAGPGVMQDGGNTYGVGGWNTKAKKWIHNWFGETGTHGVWELVRCEGNTYTGSLCFVDGNGNAATLQSIYKLLDQDHFEVTNTLNDQQTIIHFYRTKD